MGACGLVTYIGVKHIRIILNLDEHLLYLQLTFRTSTAGRSMYFVSFKRDSTLKYWTKVNHLVFALKAYPQSLH